MKPNSAKTKNRVPIPLQVEKAKIPGSEKLLHPWSFSMKKQALKIQKTPTIETPKLIFLKKDKILVK